MSGALVRKYARSLAEVALEKEIHEKVKGDLEGFNQLCHRHGELRSALENPAVPFSSKRNIVAQIGTLSGLSSEVVNFVTLLLQNNRIQLLPEIPAAFQEALNQKLGVLSGDVYAPVPLSDGQKAEIRQRLAAFTGRKVELDFHEDPALIGGVKIQVGSVIYDASVQKQLEEIRRQIV